MNPLIYILVFDKKIFGKILSIHTYAEILIVGVPNWFKEYVSSVYCIQVGEMDVKSEITTSY
jgi:hypothetical protein